MRTSALIVVFTLVSFGAYSRDSAYIVYKFRREIGLNVLSSEYLTADSPFMPSSDLVILPGLFYRQYWNKNALRISLEYAKKTFHTPPDPPNVSLSDSLHTIKQLIDLRIGYQRSFGNWHRVHPYVFSEFMTRVLYCNGSWNDRFTGEADLLNYRVVSGGLTMGAGIQVIIWRTLSVCYEADAHLLAGKRYDFNSKSRRNSFDLTIHQIRTFGIAWGF